MVLGNMFPFLKKNDLRNMGLCHTTTTVSRIAILTMRHLLATILCVLSLLAVSLEAATITNWGAQLPTAAPNSGDVILMQQGGVTYYFTPNQLAVNIATNANSVGMITNKIANLNGLATNLNIKAANGAVLALTVDTNALVVTGGKVGIGTTPTNKLDIEGAVAIGATPSGSTVAPANGLLLQGHLIFDTDNTSDIGASGATRPRNAYVAGNVTSGGFVWGASLYTGASASKITSPSDGVIQISDNAGSAVNRLQLGGTTAAFPAIGRTNGHLVVFSAAGAFSGGATNSLWLMGGGIIQDFSFVAPTAPGRQGAVYWNDGTNVCAVLRDSAGTLTTNKLSMTAWP